MPITLIAAAAGPKMVIGKNGDLPWHFSADLKFFKETTHNQTVLMGRVTHESIVKRLGKALPNRHSIVVTHDKNFSYPGVTVVHDIEALFKDVAKGGQIFVIGGASIYRQALAFADTILMTHIDADYDGDAFFPPFGAPDWQLATQRMIADSGTTLRFCSYKKLL